MAEEVFNSDYEICLHCDEPMVYQDMFGLMWCEDIYWGSQEGNDPGEDTW